MLCAVQMCLTVLKLPPEFLDLRGIDQFYKKAMNSKHSDRLFHAGCNLFIKLLQKNPNTKQQEDLTTE